MAFVAYLLEEMWTDALENDSMRAMGYTQVAATLSHSEAIRWVTAGGVHPGSAWPAIAPGTPRRRLRSIPLIGSVFDQSREAGTINLGQKEHDE